MGKIKLFYLKNVMLASNGIANLLGAVFVTALLSKFTNPILPVSLVSVVQKFHLFFTVSAFCFAIVFTYLYRRPIRFYLDSLFTKTDLSAEIATGTRQKLLNEPFVLLSMDLGIWLAAAVAYPGMNWIIGSGKVAIQISFANALANGLVTVTLAFFLLEHFLKKSLAP